MEARVNDESPLSTVVACAGVIFSRQEYTTVPEGHEEEVKNHPYLEPKKETKAAPKRKPRTVKDEPETEDSEVSESK